MKNLIRIPLTLTLLFATCCLCLGQEFYRGELFVTGQHFSLTNGHLNVELSVDFEGLKMPSDESLTVTPVLKTVNTSRSFLPYSSMGRRNKKYIRGHRFWRLVNAIMLRYALRQFRQW